MSQETSEISSPPEGASGELSDWAEFARQIRVESGPHGSRREGLPYWGRPFDGRHPGGALFGHLARATEEPQWGDRDRMILSKGIAARRFTPRSPLRDSSLLKNFGAMGRMAHA